MTSWRRACTSRSRASCWRGSTHSAASRAGGPRHCSWPTATGRTSTRIHERRWRTGSLLSNARFVNAFALEVHRMRRRHSLLSALILASLCVAVPSAFDVPTHRDITATVSGKEVHFSQRALEEVAQANEDTDDLSSAALFHPERHFTNERFLEGTTELINQRRRVISSVTASPADGRTGRQARGRALHSIQDFYSHSNWVEQGKSSPIGSFGTGTTAN